MSFLSDIREDNESQDLLMVERGGKLVRSLYTDVYYSSRKGWFIIVRGISYPIRVLGEGAYIIDLRPETTETGEVPANA